MPGGSRIVFDLTGPAKISNAYVLGSDNGQPARLVLEFSQVDRATFDQSLQSASQPQVRPAIADVVNTASSGDATQSGDAKRVVSFRGDISARVVAVDKSGLLQIKGTKVVDVDKNKQSLNITGWVRPEDVSPDNVVASERIADANLTYTLNGALGKTRGGIIGRLLSVFWP